MPIALVLLPPNVVEVTVAPIIVDFVIANENIGGTKSNLDFSKIHVMRDCSDLIIVNLLSLANHEFSASHENYDIFNLMFDL